MQNTRIKMDNGEQKKVMLNILSSFADFCDIHDLNYFLDAGTLLGAVRHKGFIPWDDDIDVNMPINDYLKFIELTKKNSGKISNHLVVQYSESTLYPYLKISDERSVLIEFPDRFPLEIGVYIDVFPKVGVLDDKFSTKLICFITSFCQKAYWFNKFSVYTWKKEKNILKKMIANIAYVFVKDSTFPIKLQQKIIKNYIKKHPLKDCKYVTTLTNGEFNKRSDKHNFDAYIMMNFEDKKFRCPIGYDDYLRCLYPGDYMELPPVDKRVSHNTLIYWKSKNDKDDFYANNKEGCA